MTERIQAKHVPEDEVLRWVFHENANMRLACRWRDYGNMPDSLRVFPDKVLLARLRSMRRRGLIEGCCCGCRGDFELTKKGQGALEIGSGR